MLRQEDRAHSSDFTTLDGDPIISPEQVAVGDFVVVSKDVWCEPFVVKPKVGDSGASGQLDATFDIHAELTSENGVFFVFEITEVGLGDDFWKRADHT